MLHTPACDILRIRHPVCQAGMARYTSAELVAAVSRAGGLGVHGSLGRGADELRHLIRATRALLRGEPFGVNLVVRRTDDAILDLCLAERVPVIVLSWGDPRPWTARARATGAVVMYQVTTTDEVPAALQAGVDLLIAQGTEGGGHSGFIPLATLLPAVAAAAGRGRHRRRSRPRGGPGARRGRGLCRHPLPRHPRSTRQRRLEGRARRRRDRRHHPHRRI
jgi:nitronate monooxygenase